MQLCLHWAIKCQIPVCFYKCAKPPLCSVINVANIGVFVMANSFYHIGNQHLPFLHFFGDPHHDNKKTKKFLMLKLYIIYFENCSLRRGWFSRPPHGI